MSRFRLILLAACLGLLIVGARLALFHHYGTDLPEMDEWDAEGVLLFLPWSLGQLQWSAFFVPQNEHRVVLTHGLAFVLTALNGQWDQRVEAAALTLLPAALALIWWQLAAKRLTRPWQIALFLVLASASALPVAWQNILAGFASAQFFLIGLSLGTIALLPFAEPFHLKWWAGVACAVGALGSLGSGFFAAVVVAALLVYQVWRGIRRWSSAAPGLGVCALLTVAGVMLRVVVSTSDSLHAHSVGEFVLTVAKALGWPAFDLNWGALSLLLVLPWVWVTARLLDPRRHRERREPWQEFLAGMGGWVLLQIMAAGYARGAGGPSPASRYVDTLIVSSVVNLLCLHALWARTDWASPRRNVLAVFVGAWMLLFFLGLTGETYAAFREELPSQLAFHSASEAHVRNYLATGDEDYLRHPGEIPYPTEWAMKRDLDYPGLANLMPVSVRRPLALAADPAGLGFVRCDSRAPEKASHPQLGGAGLGPTVPQLANGVTWGSFSAQQARGPSTWRSQPFNLRRSEWLEFRISGDLGRQGTHLELRDAAASRPALTVAPREILGQPWRSAGVKVPAGRWVVAACNDTEATWFGFSEPTEMSVGSHAVERLTQSGSWLTWGAGLLSLGVLLIPMKRVQKHAPHL